MICIMVAKCSALDVAKYILKKHGPMTAMKLQKLVYYCQAWSLVWDDRPMFRDKIKAWANGPVVPALYHALKGRFEVNVRHLVAGDSGTLDKEARDTVDGVLSFYGGKAAQWLSDLTHAERPWLEARGSLGPGEPGGSEITISAMVEYYESLKKKS